MTNRNIVEYIIKNSQRGFSSQRIRQSLLAQGHSDYEINDAFRYIESGNKELPEKKSVFTTGSFFESGFFKLILGVLILIALIALILLVLPERQSFSVSDFLENTSLEISKENAKIRIGEDNKVMDISLKDQVIGYSFEGIEGSLSQGEEEMFDLDNNGEYDFFIKYESINSENFPVLIFGKYVPCVPDWNCGNWGECIDGIQIRNCIDENSCDSLEDRPILEKSCVVEEEVVVENETELNETEVNESLNFSSPEEACQSKYSSVYINNSSQICFSDYVDSVFNMTFNETNISCCRGDLVLSPEEACDSIGGVYLNESYSCNIYSSIDFNGSEIDCCTSDNIFKKYVLTSNLTESYDSISFSGECDYELGLFLEDCSAYKCSFVHPLSGEDQNRSVLYRGEDFCYYYESVPGDGVFLCKYNSTNQARAANYWTEYYSEENVSEVSFLSEMLNQGICQILD